MAILSDIPPGLTDLLNSPPGKGNRNIWLFTFAMRARYFASLQKVLTFLYWVAEQWTDRDFGPEIERAVRRAYSGQEAPIKTRRRPAWPGFSPSVWERRKTHPYPFSEEPIPITSEKVIDALYTGDSLLCASLDIRFAMTQRRDAWRGKESALQFIVANTMIAETGINQSGKHSYRSLENATKQRVYQVVEFDRGSFSEQAAILASLSCPLIPLILVVWSGGKSLHGWFRVSELSEYGKLRFFRHAVFLGADSSLWDPSKLVRMPGGRRDNGKTQSIHYFNLNPFDQ